MPNPQHTITRQDIMDMVDYAAVRVERRKAVTQLKKHRRLHIGPDVTLYFESYDTIWHQIHEMLYIEKGGEAQIADELNAYSGLIPNGRELVCTLMFEIDDPDRRANALAGLGGVENTVSIQLGDDVIMGVPEDDIERTNADGKASSIHFLHFPFSDDQAAFFKRGTGEVLVKIGHEKYGHMAVMPLNICQALGADLDD